MVSETSPRYRPDILERAKAADIDLMASTDWGQLRNLFRELIAEVEAKQANNEYLQKMTEEAQGIMQESQLLLCKEANEAEQLQNEVERLRSVISEPVKSFGTMELVSWANQLQKTISEYPDAEWGNWPFVLMMGVHCENFSKRWHSPTIELMAARIKELEAEVEAKNKQIKELQDIIDKPPEEADWVADYHLLQSALDGPIIDAARKWHAAYRTAQNSNLMRAKEVERLRAALAHELDLRNRHIESLEARIKELEEANRNIDKRRDEMAAFIERLEAAFLEAKRCPTCNGAGKLIDVVISRNLGRVESERVCPLCEGKGEEKAREALEQLRAEGKIGGGDGE